MRQPVISLCDFTGNMVRPWADAGHRCFCFDIRHEERRTEGLVTYLPLDLNRVGLVLLEYPVIGFAFPACTNGAVSGARWFADKGLQGLIEYLTLVESCRRILEGCGCRWMLENPVSTLSSYWRKPDFSFHPFEYAGYEGGEGDLYTKKTCLWTGGGFVMPEKKTISGAIPDQRIHRMAPSVERGNLRSVTPPGFARAVYEANSQNVEAEPDIFWRDELITQLRRELDFPICGHNNSLSPREVLGCGNKFTSLEDIFKCADCETPFHKHCIKNHFSGYRISESAVQTDFRDTTKK